MVDENYKNISDDSFKSKLINDLSPISPAIYTVLETAQSIVPDCVEIFNRRCGKKVQEFPKIYKSLYPPLMRGIMQILLKSENLKTQLVNDYDGKKISLNDWGREILSNNGLMGDFAGHDYRILKALKANTLNEMLPPPGQSWKKREFYNQKQLLQSEMPFFPNAGIAKKHNVIFLWDNPNENSVSLYLCCPKWGTHNKAGAYFIEPIEHPVLSVMPLVNTEEIVEEINLEKIQTEENTSLNGDEQNDSTKDDLRSEN